MRRHSALIAMVIAVTLAAFLATREARRRSASSPPNTSAPVSYLKLEVCAPETGGVVKEILIPGFVEHEQSGAALMVKRGDPLLRLENKAVGKQWNDLQTMLKANHERQESLQNQEQATRNVLEQNRIRNEIASLRAVEILLLKEQRIVAQMREDLSITSPMDGQIQTDGLHELNGRALEPGEFLFEIIDAPNQESNSPGTGRGVRERIHPAPDPFLLSSIH